MQISLSSLVPFKSNYGNNKRSYGSYPNLAPLKADTISFGAKKNEFQGIDLLVVNKFKAPIEKFKNNDDLQNWCGDEIQKCLNKDYKGRQKETTIQRKAMLKEWSDYVKYENDAYNNAISLLILDGITKKLKSDNDTLPPVLNKGVLADTISEIQEKIKTNPKAQIDFNKLYQTKLKEMYTSEITDKNDEIKGNTGWIVIPGKKNDSDNFETNVEKLKALSHDSWCTKSIKAEPYLSQGDFHIYQENGMPRIGIRFVGNKIQEIEGENNNTKIPLKYFDIVKSHIKNEKLDQDITFEIKKAQEAQNKILQVQQKLGKPFNECTSGELFSAFNMLEKVDDDGLLILKEYKQPDEYFSWNDICIEENELFKNVKEIRGNANFEDSNIINLGKLEKISGNAKFLHSKIEKLGNLKEIKGSAYFPFSKITSLENLQIIGGVANFAHSQIIDLGNLQEIGKWPNFFKSKIVNLGNLKKIGSGFSLRDSQLKPSDFDKIEVGGEIL